MDTLFGTPHSYPLLVARLTLGLVMFPHGAQKLLGWWGGHGFSGTMGFFTETMGVPWIVALLVVLGEFAGSLGLIVGLLTRVAAIGIVLIMLGAIFMVHLPVGFFMDWQNNLQGEGYEFHLLAIGLALALLLGGGGAYSADRVIATS